MRRDLLSVSSLLQSKTRLYAQDYRSILQLAVPGDVVYLDPPYQGVNKTRDPRYLQPVAFETFAAELDCLNQRHISYIVSYDGRTGAKSFGQILPDRLNLDRIELHAGRSSQATLLGKQADTYESLYLSPALRARLHRHDQPQQLTLFPELV